MAKDAAIARALDRADPAIRCYLLYGPDESASRALAERLATALGPDAERIDLDPGRLSADPAILADEAASIAMFGGPRHIRVEGVTDSCLAAIEALLEAPAAGNPVVLIAGALRKDSPLVKLLGGDSAAMAFASWPPEERDAAALAIDLARAQGLRLDGDMARLLVQASGGDRAVLASELEKLALYADAAPDRPQAVDPAMIEAIGADNGEADTSRFVNAVTMGDEAMLDAELVRLAAEGREGIGLVRPLLGRLIAMAGARADIERGMDPSSAATRNGWGGPRSKEVQAIQRDVRHWPSARLARAIERLSQLNRDLTHSAGAGPIAADAEFFAIARQGRRR
jgi:DNA polymerase III subunit delta